MASIVSVIVSLSSGAVQTGLTKIRGQFAKFRHELSGELGSFLAVGGLVHSFESILEKATKIANLAKRFDVAPKEVQRVANAAKDVAELEDVARSFNKLAVNQQKAIQGNEEMRKNFEKLGIPMKEVVNLAPDQLFYRIADATASAEDRGKAYAAVVAIMGRNAGLLYSTLEKGSGTIQKQGDEMGIMADKTIEKLHQMHLQIEKLKNTLFIYGGAIIVFFQRVVESIGALVGETANEIELAVNLLMAAKNLIAGFGKGLLHGQISIDTRPFMNAMDDVKRNAGALKTIMAGVWSTQPEHAAGDHRNPTDHEVDPTQGETAQAEKLITLREKLAEIERKSANDQLNAAEKILALTAQRAALLKEAAGTKDEEKKLSLQIDAANIAQEIIAAQKEAARAVEEADRESLREADLRAKIEAEAPRIASNSLRRIGGQETGGFAVAGIDDKLLREQTKHTKLLEDIKENTKSGGGALNMQ